MTSAPPKNTVVALAVPPADITWVPPLLTGATGQATRGDGRGTALEDDHAVDKVLDTIASLKVGAARDQDGAGGVAISDKAADHAARRTCRVPPLLTNGGAGHAAGGDGSSPPGSTPMPPLATATSPSRRMTVPASWTMLPARHRGR